MSDPQLYFFRDGIHTHLVVPSAALLRVLPELAEQLQDTEWARIGWGDYRYYGSAQQTLLLGLRALLLPTRATIAVLGIADINKHRSATSRTYRIDTNLGVIDAVVAFISRHFKVDRSNQLVKVRARDSGEIFFQSRGIYMCINTCNNWTSRGLRIAGLRCLPRFNFLPGQVERSVRRNGYLPLPLFLPPPLEQGN
ncbi:DUF2459 domain-containing protein [SAR92 clade bacterium H455]|uniref:DUF2459 domain-containing protein n=1 Tax=SAR92 clade bacterium H455 TaxID=2974818 RepID=A0ABY5TR25_9GAMM|nr:DUF2459 domain-containing protein [SAR92 clade bacterium H455]